MKAKIFAQTQDLKNLAANLATLIFFALFLVLPGAYSAPALLMFAASLWTMPAWSSVYRDPQARCWVWYFLGVALFWAISFDGWWRWNFDGDMPIKYALAAICVLGARALRIHPKVLIYALALGCVLAGILAISQFMATGKATGHTNAIRFGDIAILMGVMCWVFVAVPQFSAGQRLIFLLAGSMGVLASLLSLSRGGWPFLLLAPVVFFWGFYRDRLNKVRLLATVGVVAVVGTMTLLAIQDVPALNARVTQAKEEVGGYFSNRDKYVHTSVGVRLEQWRMSWMLGLEKPLTGWGDYGVWEGRKQYVERGEVDASALEIAHTHNEFLELWARRGLIGVLCLALIYSVPFFLFLPKKNGLPEEKKILYTALHVAGMLVPAAYFIFGLSEVFFFLNIGNIFYIFSMVFLLSAIKSMEQEGAAS